MTVVDPARTRAEQVRARRSQVHRPTEPAEPRSPRSKTRRPRRFLELAVPAEIGAGLRLPALPAFRAGARAISVVVSLGLTWALVTAFRSPDFRLERAEVSPTELLNESQVRSIADVDGRAIFLVPPAAARARLMAQPEIRSATVVVHWPNRVELRIEERRPMVEWDDAGQIWWVSADGVAFLKHGDLDNLIRVTATEPILDIRRDPLAPVLDPEALWSAGALLAQLPEATGLEYHPDHGFGFTDPKGWEAYFGTGGDMVLKVQLYRKISEVLVQRGIAAEVVSVEDPAAPFYRKK